MAYRYFLKLAYHGSGYSGWQIQPNALSIQRLVENGLSVISGVKNGVTGCGRTDAGVSASTFYAHFDSEEAFSGEALNHILFKLNRFLPQDISILGIVPVLPEAHARFSALWREYEYLIIRKKDPFMYDHAYFVHGHLDLNTMNVCASLLKGRHDFECFSKVHTQVNNFFCEVHSAGWDEEKHLLKFTIRADRFLRNMVRAIVGTLLDVGRGKITQEEFQGILASHNRSKAGYSVPAKGLTLTDVSYPENIFTDEPIFFATEYVVPGMTHINNNSEINLHTRNESDE